MTRRRKSDQRRLLSWKVFNITVLCRCLSPVQLQTEFVLRLGFQLIGFLRQDDDFRFADVTDSSVSGSQVERYLKGVVLQRVPKGKLQFPTRPPPKAAQPAAAADAPSDESDAAESDSEVKQPSADAMDEDSDGSNAQNDQDMDDQDGHDDTHANGTQSSLDLSASGQEHLAASSRALYLSLERIARMESLRQQNLNPDLTDEQLTSFEGHMRRQLLSSILDGAVQRWSASAEMEQ